MGSKRGRQFPSFERFAGANPTLPIEHSFRITAIGTGTKRAIRQASLSQSSIKSCASGGPTVARPPFTASAGSAF